MPIIRTVDKTFFKTWSHDMAYVLGFLFADGTVTVTKRNTHFIAFHTMDVSLLQSMRASMKACQKISKRSARSGNVYRLQIGSKEMVEDVARLGLCGTKAHRMRLPKIPSRYRGDFVRGFFDGDGNVWVGTVHTARGSSSISISTAFTSASVRFLQDLHLLLKDMHLIGGSIYVHPVKKYGRLAFAKGDSLKLYEIMYNGHALGSLYLGRKRAIFDAFVKMRT